MPRGCRLLLDMVDLDRAAATPLHRQLYESLRLQILDGRLPPRSRLPASRALALDLGVSRNTVIAAYDALQAEGYLDAVTGSGTRVAPLPASPARTRAGRPAPTLPRRSELQPRPPAQVSDACECSPVGLGSRRACGARTRASSVLVRG